MPIIGVPSSSPQNVWGPGLAKVAANVVFQNMDAADVVTLGTDGSVEPLDSNAAAVLGPGASITLDGSVGYWAITDATDTPSLLVTAGSGFSGSPADIAAQVAASALAQSIASLIAGEGLTLVGGPEIMYQLGSTTVGTPGLVGFTVPNQALVNAGCYAHGDSQAAADTNSVNVVSRGNGQHLYVTKKFWFTGPHAWDVTGPHANDIGNYAAFGTKVVFCLEPVFTLGLPAGSTTAGTTADRANLATFLANIQAMGFTAQTAQIVFWQEPGNATKGISATDYANMLRYYGPTVNASIFPLVINVNYTGSINRATDYANAALGLRGNPSTGVTFAGIAMDWYTNSWGGGNYLDTTDSNGDSITGIADAQLLPFGLNEWGCDPSSFTNAQCLAYMVTDPHSVLNFMSGRLAAGKVNLDCIYYQGQCDLDGAGDITSPIWNVGDFRTGSYQEVFDGLTTLPGGGALTIAANHTTTIAPETPSPVGNLAATDQLSYELSLSVSAGPASTNPWLEVIINFFDLDQPAANQIPTDPLEFMVPMGTSGDPNGPNQAVCIGPLRGAYMSLKLNNQDSVACTVTSLQMVGTGRPAPGRHVCRTDVNAGNTPAIPGYTRAQAAYRSLQLGRITSFSLAPGASQSWLCGMFPGQAYYRFYAANTGSQDVNFTVQPQPTGVYGTENMYNNSVGGGPTTNEDRGFIGLPRAPVVVTAKNNDATNTASIDFQLIAVET